MASSGAVALRDKCAELTTLLAAYESGEIAAASALGSNLLAVDQHLLNGAPLPQSLGDRPAKSEESEDPPFVRPEMDAEYYDAC